MSTLSVKSFKNIDRHYENFDFAWKYEVIFAVININKDLTMQT